MKVIDPSEIIERESAEMGRPCKTITQSCQVYRDALEEEHETWLVIYDCSSESQWQTRWCVYTDGEPKMSGIIRASARL